MITTNKKIFYIMLVALLSPTTTLVAAFDAGIRPTVNPLANNATFINILTGIFSLIWTVFIAFAIVMFIVAGFQFLAAQGEPDVLGKARKSVLWGAIGLAVGVLAFLLPFIVRFWIF